MVKGGLGSRHERATDGYFVAPKIKKFIRQYPGRQPYIKKTVENHNRYPSWTPNGPFRIYTIWSNNEVSSVFPWSWLYQAITQADVDR